MTDKINKTDNTEFPAEGKSFVETIERKYSSHKVKGSYIRGVLKEVEATKNILEKKENYKDLKEYNNLINSLQNFLPKVLDGGVFNLESNKDYKNDMNIISSFENVLEAQKLALEKLPFGRYSVQSELYKNKKITKDNI